MALVSITNQGEQGGEPAEMGVYAWEMGEEGGVDAEDEVSADEFELMFKRFAQEPIPVHVAEVLVEGNCKTNSTVFEALLEPLKKAETTRQLLREAAYAVNRIEGMGLFEKCILSLETGPTSGSVKVVLHVQELKWPFSVDLTAFSRNKDQNLNLGGSVRWRDLLGYGETWDGTGTHGWDGDHEFGAGFHLPLFKCLPSAFITRFAVATPDWLKLSAYKFRFSEVSVRLFSNNYQDLSYSLTWQPLQDDDCANGPGLLPCLKYSFKMDERDSISRPLRGYAFRFASQFAGGGSDVSKHSACQDVDFRLSIPLGVHNAALNFGLSGGWMVRCAKDYSRNSVFSTSHRFFVGRHSSLVCEMNGPSTVLDLIARGMRFSKQKEAEDETEPLASTKGRYGSALAATGFADLSFDLPLKSLRLQDLYSHFFFCTGNIFDLSEVGKGSNHLQSFLSSIKCFVGAGIVIPTKFFRLEVNFCQVLRPHLDNESKRGVQIGFSSPC